MARAYRRVEADAQLLREAAFEYEQFAESFGWREGAYCRRRAKRLRELAQFIEDYEVVLAPDGSRLRDYASELQPVTEEA